jgi:hypothetical protein
MAAPANKANGFDMRFDTCFILSPLLAFAASSRAGVTTAHAPQRDRNHEGKKGSAGWAEYTPKVGFEGCAAEFMD